MIINDFSTVSDASNVGIDLQYPNIPTLVTSTISRAISGNWKTFKNTIYPSFEGYAVRLLISILGPMLNDIPCDDMFNME